MTDFSNVTHLLFDHDGVLVDTEYWYFKATQDELAAMDIGLMLDEYMEHMVTGRAAYASQLSTDEREAFRERRNRRGWALKPYPSPSSSPSTIPFTISCKSNTDASVTAGSESTTSSTCSCIARMPWSSSSP